MKFHLLSGKAGRVSAAVALAGVAGATALAVVPGTFGGFTASATNAGNSVTAGTVSINDNVAGPVSLSGTGVYTASNLEPGKSVSGTVTIANNGSLPETITLQIANVSSTFGSGDVQVTVADADGNTIFSNYGLTNATNSSAITLPDASGATPTTTWAGTSATPHAETYTVTVSLPGTDGNTDQGKTASFDLDWAGTQA
jgi:hypothetical protein